MSREAPGEFPIPEAVPFRSVVGQRGLVEIKYKPADVGVEPPVLDPDITASFILREDHWNGLPDENKRIALRIFAEGLGSYLERRKRRLEP